MEEGVLSENHQSRQVPTLSQHDHNHLNSNHAHLVPSNHNLHVTTITCHSPLSGLDLHDLRTHLLLLLQVSVIAHLLRSPFRTPASESQPVILYQISPSDCFMLPATAAPQLPSLGSMNLPLSTSFSSCGLPLYCDTATKRLIHIFQNKSTLNVQPPSMNLLPHSGKCYTCTVVEWHKKRLSHCSFNSLVCMCE